MARSIGTQAAIFAGGIACLAGSAFFLRKLPGLKSKARPVYEKMGIIPEVAEGIQTASEPAAQITELIRE
jgi:hypothetical protein